MKRFARSVLLLVIACGLGLCATACGGGGDATADSSASGGAGGEAAELADGPPGPRIAPPGEEPPDHLVTRDLRKGDGRVAKAGDYVVLNYKGINWNGALHGSSWTFRKPPEFRIGGRRLYLGLDFGIRGMREGGRRELRIPPRLGFERGVKPWGGPLGPEDSLLYIVDLVEVTKAGA